MNISKKNPGGIFQPHTLEVDERIFDKNLRIVDEINEGNVNSQLFEKPQSSKNSLLPETPLPSISVIPDPGSVHTQCCTFSCIPKLKFCMGVENFIISFQVCV